jgi:hypothetical protein
MRNGFLGSAAALAAVMMMAACGPSRPGSDDAGFDAGPLCGVGGCVQHGDSGTDAGKVDGGTQGDGGPQGDGGTQDAGTWDGGTTDGGAWTVTIEDLRGPAVPYGTKVLLQDVVVTAVSFEVQADGGTYNGMWRSEFWVTDPARPEQGMWVRKFYTDPPETDRVAIGDKLTIEGWFGTEAKHVDRHGYRRGLKSQFDFLPPAERPGAPMVIVKTAQVAAPADNPVTAGQFGDAQGGAVKANVESAGARVHVQGPVEITDPSPLAFKRISANANDPVYFGFEISGGILVNNYKTFSASGGCAWRDVALDAGTGQKVVFQGGVKGVWDTFTHAPCADGGTAFNCFREEGRVPGADAGFTMVLYPQSCDDFVGGVVQ